MTYLYDNARNTNARNQRAVRFRPAISPWNYRLAYKSAMAQARLMLSKGLITKDEYAIIDTMMAEKYGLSSCSLFRDNDLLYSSTRGNMSHYEEVTKCQE